MISVIGRALGFLQRIRILCAGTDTERKKHFCSLCIQMYNSPLTQTSPEAFFYSCVIQDDSDLFFLEI